MSSNHRTQGGCGIGSPAIVDKKPSYEAARANRLDSDQHESPARFLQLILWLPLVPTELCRPPVGD
jgi:hypothetical protein